jgi:hypothetical protein
VAEHALSIACANQPSARGGIEPVERFIEQQQPSRAARTHARATSASRSWP